MDFTEHLGFEDWQMDQHDFLLNDPLTALLALEEAREQNILTDAEWLLIKQDMKPRINK